MTDIKIERHKWQPNFKDETWITATDGDDTFQITLKQGEDIEITFDWDRKFDGARGFGRMAISVDLLKELIAELGM